MLMNKSGKGVGIISIPEIAVELGLLYLENNSWVYVVIGRDKKESPLHGVSFTVDPARKVCVLKHIVYKELVDNAAYVPYAIHAEAFCNESYCPFCEQVLSVKTHRENRFARTEIVGVHCPVCGISIEINPADDHIYKYTVRQNVSTYNARSICDVFEKKIKNWEGPKAHNTYVLRPYELHTC